MLIAVAASCVWLGWQCDFARRQREAVVKVEELGGFAFYSHEWDDSNDFLSLTATRKPWPTWLEKLVGIDSLDPVVAAWLDGGSEVKDSDLAWILDRLPRLRSLNLHGASITSAGISRIAELPKLRTLDLADTCINDSAMPNIGQLHALRSLDLCHTRVTDHGLLVLHRLRELRSIYVESTGVTEEGMAQLRHALPQVKRRRY